MQLVIKNGRLVDPATGYNGVYDIGINNGKIVEISSAIPAVKGDQVIDASGLIVSPGFIDLHVHLREPGQEHKETIESGARAAVYGGFTSIACMPNTTPVNDNDTITGWIVKRGKEVGLANVFPIAAISMKQESKTLTDMESLVKAGAVGFSDDGRCVMSGELFKEALIKARELNVPVIEHPEDHEISKDGQVNDGETARQLGVRGIPAAAEDNIIERDIRLQEETESYLHLTHLSTIGSVELLRQAKGRNVRVTSDVTPHHLLLDDSVLKTKNSNYKMKPPLRSEKDRIALIEGLRAGIIDCIASDHAPHSREEKNKSFESAPFGIIGLETSFNVIFDGLVRRGIIDLNRMIETFSTIPARILHLNDRGIVKQGFPADLSILDLEKPFKITGERFQSKSINCPFIGWEGKGIVAYTVVNGRVVFDQRNG